MLYLDVLVVIPRPDDVVDEQGPRLASVQGLPAVAEVGQRGTVVHRRAALDPGPARSYVVQLYRVARTLRDDLGREPGSGADAPSAVTLEDGRADVLGPLGAGGGFERRVAPKHPAGSRRP